MPRLGGGGCAVWLRGSEISCPASPSLLLEGSESWTRPGSQPGSTVDGDPDSLVVTNDRRAAVEDWYAVEVAEPVRVGWIVFRHGRNFHDGGWFNTSAGKPQLEVGCIPGGPWEQSGELAEYPPTTATDPAGLRPGQAFTLRLAEPVPVFSVRVVGRRACGDNPNQAFSSCAEWNALLD